MRIWVACLCIPFLETAYSKTSRKINKIPVRETSESFPYLPPWEPKRIKPNTEKLMVEEFYKNIYLKPPIGINTEFNNQKQEVSVKDYEYESKLDNTSFTWEPIKITPEKNKNYGTKKLKGEKEESDNSQLEFETKCGLTKPKENASSSSSNITPYPPISTQLSYKNDSITSQVPLMVVKPIAPVPNPGTPLTEYSSPAPSPPTTLLDYNPTIPTTFPSYPSPPPTLSHQEEAWLPLQTQSILIPSAESIFYPPRPLMENSSPILHPSKKNSPPKSHKDYSSSGSSTSTPCSTLSSTQSPQENDPTPSQEPQILVQPAALVTYPQRPLKEYSPPAPLPSIESVNYSPTIVSTTPPYPPPQEEARPPLKTQETLTSSAPSIRYTSRPLTEYSSPVLQPSKINSPPKSHKEYTSPKISTPALSSHLSSTQPLQEESIILVQERPTKEFSLPAPLSLLPQMNYKPTISFIIPPYFPTLSPEEAHSPFQESSILIPPEESISFLPKLDPMHDTPKAHGQDGPSFGLPITSSLPSMLSLINQTEGKTPFQELLILLQPVDLVSGPKTDHIPVLLPPIQPFNYNPDPSKIVSFSPTLPTLLPEKDQSPLMILIPSTELIPDSPKDDVQQSPKPASHLLKPVSEYGLLPPLKEHSPLFNTQISFPPLTSRSSPYESHQISAIDTVLLPPILPEKNYAHN
nr:leucine-rich repeat extensin-like protein 5 [Halyomorpha halys]